MKKIITFLVLTICTLTIAKAEGRDSNVVISNANLNYSFDYSRRDKAVSIKQEQTTTYSCVNYRTNIAVGEEYDDETTVDDVKITVDGNKAKNIIPKYDFMSSGDYFFTDEHICYFELPLTKKGSSSEVHFEKTIKDPRYFSDVYFTNNRFNIQNKTVTFEIPRWMKVELKEFNFAGNNITKSSEYDSRKNADIITYTIKNLSAPSDEVHSPGMSYTEPHLLVHCEYVDAPDGKITYFNTLADQRSEEHTSELQSQ